MNVGHLRIPRLKREILDLLDDRGPLDRTDITVALAKKRGISRHCTCCTHIHAPYDALIDDTIDALTELERAGEVVWKQSDGKWHLT